MNRKAMPNKWTDAEAVAQCYAHAEDWLWSMRYWGYARAINLVVYQGIIPSDPYLCATLPRILLLHDPQFIYYPQRRPGGSGYLTPHPEQFLSSVSTTTSSGIRDTAGLYLFAFHSGDQGLMCLLGCRGCTLYSEEGS